MVGELEHHQPQLRETKGATSVEMIEQYLTKKKTMRPTTMTASVLTMPMTTPITVLDTGTPAAVNMPQTFHQT